MKREMAVIMAVAIAAPFCIEQSFAQGSTQGPVKVSPPAAVTAKAAAPAASAQTKQGTTVGKDKLKVNASNASNETDSVWVEELDIDGDGNVEQTDLLWDDEDKVLYLHAAGTFTCANGGTGEGGMLVAIFGDGNAMKKPAGSGWYAVELDKSECAAEAAVVFGCKFDAQGNATACGAVKVDEKNDDIVIVTVTK